MSESKRYPLSFTGNGGEYFAIWIVNMALTLVTLGIYSAWAKVRTARWFYGHTLLDGQVFSYLATPMQVLKGRLIAIGVMLVYVLAGQFAPTLAVVLAVLLFLAMPWIVVSSLRFSARMSAYRGLRFDFTGTLGEAALIYVLLPLLIPFTLGLILPYFAYRQVRFVANNLVYGQTASRYAGGQKPFWGLYGLAFVCSLLPLILIAVAIIGFSVGKNAPAAMGIASLGFLAFYGMAALVGAMIMARTANLLYNGTQLGPVAFESSQRARELAWLYISNIVLLACTLGLFYPWAKVRLARYRSSRLVLIGPEDLGNFVAGQQQGTSASGAEISDVFDINVGLV